MPTTERIKNIPAGIWRRQGQSKNAFRLIIDGDTSAATVLLAEPVPVVQSSLPLSAATGTSGYVPTDNFTCARLVFGGSGSAGNTLHYQVVLWYPGPVISGADELTYVPFVVAKGTAEFGTTTYTTNDMGATGNLFADTVVDDRGHGGVVVNSPGDNSKAWIDVDLHNASGIEVEVHIDTATSIDVMLQFGEMPASAAGGGAVAEGGATAPDEMYLWLDAAVGNQALADPTPIDTLPVMSVGTGSVSATTGAIFTRGKTHATIILGGVGAENVTVNYQVIGWKQAQAVAGTTLVYIPMKLAAGVGICGMATYTANELGAGSERFCDTISDTVNHFRTYIHTPIADEVAELHVDVTNFIAIEVETDIGTATSVEVLGQLGMNPSPFDSVAVVGAANDTETSSLHGKIGTDAEMADRSIYDMAFGTAGIAAFPNAAAAANDASLAEVIRYIQEILIGGYSDPNTTLHGKIGTATEMGGSSLYDFLVVGAGTVFPVTKTLDHNEIVITTGTAFTGASSGGALLIEDIIISNSATAMDSTGDGADIDVTCDNAVGPTVIGTIDNDGVAASTAYSGLRGDWTTYNEHIILETGKIITVTAGDEAFISTEPVTFTFILRRLADGATIAAA